MKRIFQSAVLFFVTFPLVLFLPLFIERTMTRSQTFGGDVIDYDWQIRTFYGFLSDSKYSRPEENFVFYLAVNLVLACLYSFVIVIFINWIMKKIRQNNSR